jgi:hypothetical protein
MPYKDKILAKFHGQRNNAERRGIEFKFTFNQWIKWWTFHLGPNWLSKRGRNGNQYCMARKGDKGPYAWRNVQCITHSQNMTESNLILPRGGGIHFLGRKHSKKTLAKMRRKRHQWWIRLTAKKRAAYGANMSKSKRGINVVR